jgi:hypothetical protein
MKRTTGNKNFLFIRAAFILFFVLLAIYVPLKIYIARSDEATASSKIPFSIFVTNELNGYREPCG